MAIKDLKKGAKTPLKKLSQEEHKTTPPPRFSETKLIAELEKRGIGRPSTFSSIVSLIQDRGYVKKKGNQLYPTPLGFAVARLLAAKFPDFTAYDYTAAMEEKLDSISEGKDERVSFLKAFWDGKTGFNELLKELNSSIDFKELEQYFTIDLHNGYSARFSRFGTFLQSDKEERDAKGYLPSVRLDDDADLWEFKDSEICKATFNQKINQKEARELGALEDGPYAGFTLWLKDGKFGPYLQAIPPEKAKAKPVNQKLPENLAPETTTFEEVVQLFSEIKLPRTLSDNFFTGIGKRGPWLARKASAKAKRAVFVGLPKDYDPRTMTLEDAEEVWKAKQAKKS